MDPAPPPSGPTTASGLRGLVRAWVLYAEARGRLVQIEAREAGTRITGATLLALATFGALFTGWLLAMPGIVWMLAERTGWHWSRAALALAAAHIVLGMLASLWLKRKLTSLRIFEESFNQLKRDREWIAGDESQP